MTQLVHSPECTAHQEAVKLAYEAWHERWPNACTQCGGYGGSGFVDRDAGPIWDTCSCVDDARCSRCGAGMCQVDDYAIFDSNNRFATLGDGYSHCLECGWTDDPAWQRIYEEMHSPEPFEYEPCDCYLAWEAGEARMAEESREAFEVWQGQQEPEGFYD